MCNWSVQGSGIISRKILLTERVWNPCAPKDLNIKTCPVLNCKVKSHSRFLRRFNLKPTLGAILMSSHYLSPFLNILVWHGLDMLLTRPTCPVSKWSLTFIKSIKNRSIRDFWKLSSFLMIDLIHPLLFHSLFPVVESVVISKCDFLVTD